MKKKSMMKKAASEDAPMMKAKRGDNCQNCMCGSCSCSHSEWGMTVLRLVVGIGFLFHGLQKLMGLSGTQGFFGMLGIPSWLGIVVALVEALGGLALVFGLWTRWASYLLAATMAGAITFAKWGWGAWGWAVIAALVVSLCAIDCAGSRRWGSWLLSGVIAVMLVAAVIKVIGGYSVDGSFNFKFELDLAYFAATLAIAWAGPGRMSIHGKCNCCTD